jgi:signal transduction histidine kinase
MFEECLNKFFWNDFLCTPVSVVGFSAMDADSLDRCRVLFGVRDLERYENYKKLFENMPGSSYELFRKDPDFVLKSSDASPEAFDICILDAHDIANWRELLATVHDSGAMTPIVILTDLEDRDFDMEALRLGAADCAVGGRLTPYALERIIRQARYRKQVAKEIRERDADLLIQERLAAVGMLASGMAHEIGTPLGVIQKRTEMLLIRNHLNESIQKDLKIIIEQSDRIARLMRSLLNRARGDDMRTSQAMDLGRVVNEVLDLMARVLMLDGVTLMKQIPESVPFKVHAESEPFHQIILNLIQNALHAIEVARESGRNDGHFLKISIFEDGGDWCLRVEDSGCGMTSDVIRNLFRPFFTTKGIGKGVGLGLSLSYRILESWRGNISVDSTPGVGTTFKITIPKA